MRDNDRVRRYGARSKHRDQQEDRLTGRPWDGLMLAEAVRQWLPDVAVVLATGSPDVFDSIADCGAVALMKPYSIEHCARHAARCLQGRTTEAYARAGSGPSRTCGEGRAPRPPRPSLRHQPASRVRLPEGGVITRCGWHGCNQLQALQQTAMPMARIALLSLCAGRRLLLWLRRPTMGARCASLNSLAVPCQIPKPTTSLAY